VRVTIVSAEHAPEAAVTTGAGTVAYVGKLRILAVVDQWPGCEVEASGRRTWVLPNSEPIGASDVRGDAARQLAQEVSNRVTDGLLGNHSCR
jgi:hypothetical protein